MAVHEKKRCNTGCNMSKRIVYCEFRNETRKKTETREMGFGTVTNLKVGVYCEFRNDPLGGSGT